jgi:hypothetical protein
VVLIWIPEATGRERFTADDESGRLSGRESEASTNAGSRGERTEMFEFGRQEGRNRMSRFLMPLRAELRKPGAVAKKKSGAPVPFPAFLPS